MIIRGSYVLFTFLIILSSLGQKPSPVVKAIAFYKVILPGFNKMDEAGNSLSTIDTSYFIYLITKGKVEPKIEEVVFNQFIYQASVFKVDDHHINVGKLKATNKMVRINVEHSQCLWRIELQKQKNEGIILPKEYNKLRVIFQKNLHWQSFEIQSGLELQPDEHN